MYRFALRALCVALLAPAVAASAAAPWSAPWLDQAARGNVSSRVERSACPRGTYAVGLTVRAREHVESLGVECAALGIDGQHRSLSTAASLGHRAGDPARSLRCASGHVITAMRARASEVIDQVAVACRSWNSRQGVHGSLRWQPALGGSNGEPVGPIECPSGMAMTTLSARTAQRHIQAVSFSCDALAPSSLR